MRSSPACDQSTLPPSAVSVLIVATGEPGAPAETVCWERGGRAMAIATSTTSRVAPARRPHDRRRTMRLDMLVAWKIQLCEQLEQRVDDRGRVHEHMEMGALQSTIRPSGAYRLLDR